MRFLLVALTALLLVGCAIPPAPSEPVYGGPGVFVYPTYCYRCAPYYSPHYGYSLYRPYPYYWHQFP